jgi:hypothetical protein
LIGYNLRPLIKVDRFGFTSPGALLALLPVQEEAIIGVNHISRWGRLRIRDIDGRMISQIFVIGIRDQNRAVARTSPAGCAFTLVYITRFPDHLY